MNKELAKTLTTALVQFIDKERPEGTMCCSNAECESIEKMFEGDKFDIIEAFIQKKLSRLTEFERAFLERVFHQKPEDLDEETKEIFLEDARFVLALAREQFIKDGYVIEKKAFHDAVEKVDPEVMKEVSDNVDNMKEELTELDQCLLDYANQRDEYEYDPTNVAELNEKVIDLTKFYANVLRTIAKKEILKDLPKWRKWENGACGNSDNNPIAIVKRGIDYKLVSTLGIQGEHYIMLSDLEKLPGFNNN
jgi:hypothetical protein